MKIVIRAGDTMQLRLNGVAFYQGLSLTHDYYQRVEKVSPQGQITLEGGLILPNPNILVVEVKPA